MQSLLINEEQLAAMDSDNWVLQKEPYSITRYTEKPKPLKLKMKDERKELYDMIKLLSHDIRSPLVTIGAALKLLKKGRYGELDEGVDAELGRLLEIVMQATGVMEDFMGMAFSQSGTLDINREIINIRKDIAEPVIVELNKIIEDRKILLFNDGLKYAPEGKAFTLGNRFLLKAVFRNLIHNAIRYGGKGCKISYSIKNQIFFHKITVFNTGKPISKEDQNILFKKFGSIERGCSDTNKGMGLGLYLVKEIVQKHGGRIWYEACKKGSKFVFTMPRIKD